MYGSYDATIHTVQLGSEAFERYGLSPGPTFDLLKELDWHHSIEALG